MAVSNQIISGIFTGTGASPDQLLWAGGFNMSLSGFGTATVQLRRSFDQGTTWHVVQEFTANAERRVDDPENGVMYDLNCSAHTDDITYRLSR